MASVVFRAASARDRVAGLLATDYCPWANRYVYWLKEPIGWFMIALTVSVLVGLHISTIGWVLASVIGSVVLVGMIWPWVVVRAAQCRLWPTVNEVHEGQDCDLILSVRNRWPVPLWGLAIEGYLDRHGDEARPTIALACVPMISDAQYRLRLSPQLRGQYPMVTPQVACSMPFGIWTARRPLVDRSPLTVFPKLSHIQDEPELSGGRASETGDGLRAGQAGEPLGVREFRSGDRLRNVHWIHTARTGTLTICERGGPQQQQVDIVLDAETVVTQDPRRYLLLREALACRVRVAASLAMALHRRQVPIRLVIGGTVIPITNGAGGRRSLLTALAAVPADGLSSGGQTIGWRPAGNHMTLLVQNGTAADPGVTAVFIDRGEAWKRKRLENEPWSRAITIVPEASLDAQLARFWREVRHSAVAA